LEAFEPLSANKDEVKSGFSEELKDLALKREDILLFSFKD